jgi:hypothetical protein
MAYPTPPATAIPDVATDTNYDAAGEDWHGTPTKATTSVAVQAQGFVPGDLRLPMFDNFLFYWIKAWILYLVAYVAELADRLDPVTPTTRTITIDPCRAIRSDAAGAPNANWEIDGAGQLTAITNGASLEISLDGILPDSAVITKLEALVNPGEPRVGGSRMHIYIAERTINWTTPLAGSSAPAISFAYDDTTTNLQVLPTPTIAYTIAKSSGKLAWIVVAAGDSAGTFNDVLYGIRVTFTDPGPRYR